MRTFLKVLRRSLSFRLRSLCAKDDGTDDSLPRTPADVNSDMEAGCELAPDDGGQSLVAVTSRLRVILTCRVLDGNHRPTLPSRSTPARPHNSRSDCK